MVYGKPLGNIASRSSGYTYDEGGPDGTQTKAEISIAAITFDSPRRAKIAVYMHGWTTGWQNTILSSSNCNITAYSSNNIEKYIQVFYNTSGDNANYVILDANFEDQPDDVVISGIRIWAEKSSEGSVTAPTAIARIGSAGSSEIFPINYITSSHVFIGSNQNSTFQVEHVCLPPNPVKGQFHYIKNATELNTFVHTFNIKIDENSAYYYTTTLSGMQNDNSYKVYTLSEWGFIIGPLHSCLVIFDGTRWVIQEYFNGLTLSPTYNFVSIPAVTPVELTKPLTICDIGSGLTKYLRLPDPDGSLKVLRVICMSSTQNNSGSIYILPSIISSTPFPSYIENNDTISVQLRPAAGIMNACITFIAALGGWWVQNVYEGSTIVHATDTTVRPSPSKPITVLQTAGLTGVQLPALTTDGVAHEFMIKKLGANSGTGIIANTTNASSVVIGSGLANSVFSNTWTTDTAITLYGIKSSGITRYYISSYSSGSY